MKTRPWGNSGIRVEAWTYGERPRRRVPVCHPPAGAVGQALSGAKRKQRNTGGGVMDGRQATPRSPGHLTDGERDREPKRAIEKKYVHGDGSAATLARRRTTKGYPTRSTPTAPGWTLARHPLETRKSRQWYQARIRWAEMVEGHGIRNWEEGLSLAVWIFWRSPPSASP